MYQFHKVVTDPVVVFAVVLDMRTILASLLASLGFRMLLVPLLLKLVLWDHTMAVHAVASRRSVKDLAPAPSTAVVTARAVASLGGSSSQEESLLVWRRCRRLHVSGVRVHGHLHSNLGNALLVIFLVDGAGPSAVSS